MLFLNVWVYIYFFQYNFFRKSRCQGTNINPIWIQYRTDEGFLVKAEGDRAIVVFEIHFSDPSDQVLAKVFLQVR